MKKLKQIAEGEYFLGNCPVNAELKYGPIMYTYGSLQNVNSELPIDSLVEQIESETGVDLERIADSYHSGGISVQNNGKITRHEIVFFFKSAPIPQN